MVSSTSAAGTTSSASISRDEIAPHPWNDEPSMRRPVNAIPARSLDHYLFEPDPALEPRILQQIAQPDCSLTALAELHGTTADALTLWMTRPDIAERCRTIISGGMTQTKMVVATRLNMCVKGLMAIVAAYHHDETEVTEPIAFHDRRLRELQRSNCIRAVNMILRAGRYDPFTPVRTRALDSRPRGSSRPASGLWPSDFTSSLFSSCSTAPLLLCPSVSSSTPSLSHSVAAPLDPPDPRLILNPKTWTDYGESVRRQEADILACRLRPVVTPSPSAYSQTPFTPHPSDRVPGPGSSRVPLVPAESVSGEAEPVPSSAALPSARAPNPTRESPARVSERMSPSTLSSPPVHPAGALHDLPIASDLRSDANSSTGPPG